MKLRNLTLLLAATVLLNGCKYWPAIKYAFDPPEQKPEVVEKAPPPPLDTSDYGSIAGIVTLKGKAPARVPIDMSMDPACAMSPEKNLSEQVLVGKGHGLANVYVYVKAGVPSTRVAANTPPVVLDQKGCRFLPHVIAIQRGGTVEFRNSDSAMHNVHAVPTGSENKPIDISMNPMGQPKTLEYDSAEVMMPVRCNNHPWMQAFINVAPNPWFAVTGPDGKFKMPIMPPGTYQVAAIHETLGELDYQVTVPAQGTGDGGVEFEIK